MFIIKRRGVNRTVGDNSTFFDQIVLFLAWCVRPVTVSGSLLLACCRLDSGLVDEDPTADWLLSQGFFSQNAVLFAQLETIGEHYLLCQI
jgi:hypothetical protein